MRCARRRSPGRRGCGRRRLLDLDLLVPACAEAHREEIGVDPLQRDADGFRWRTRQQIEEGRSWLWLEDGVIRFKAEASAWTPAAVQLQQVWVDPQARRRGYARRALRDLCRLLLEQVPAVCLFVRPENEPALGLYDSIGMTRELTYRSARASRQAQSADGRAARPCRALRPRARADPGGRRGRVPRLGRRRFDLPVAPARLARLPRLGAAREPQAARRRLRGGRPLLRRCSARRSSSWTAAVSPRPPCASSAALAPDRLRATGHTASDQVETILYRLVSRGAPTGIAPRSGDGSCIRCSPLWREETEAYCRAAGLEFRVDTSNADTKRGLIRDEILPLLRGSIPAADENLLRALDSRATLPPALAELLAAPVGSKRVDLGDGLQAVREHERLWLERGPVELAGEIRWGDLDYPLAARRA